MKAKPMPVLIAGRMKGIAAFFKVSNGGMWCMLKLLVQINNESKSSCLCIITHCKIVLLKILNSIHIILMQKK